MYFQPNPTVLRLSLAGFTLQASIEPISNFSSQVAQIRSVTCKAGEKCMISDIVRLDSGLFNMRNLAGYESDICQCVSGLSGQIGYALALRIVDH